MGEMLLRTRKSARSGRSYKLAVLFKIVYVIGIATVYLIIGSVSRDRGGVAHTVGDENAHSTRHLLGFVEGYNCTPAAINEFPSDGFTREQRQQGWAILHVVIACYLFILLAIVCDDYFVPAIQRLCDSLQMKEDIAGATFMAVASSSPELFINCVGTFITEGDIGVGTIVGSAVFNVLAVPACCGLFTNMVIQLEWWPITRDSIMYGVAVVSLIGVLRDGKVELWEACMLVSAYILYILMMCFNDKVISAINRMVRCCKKRQYYKEVLGETKPLLQDHADKNQNDIIAHEEVFGTEVTLKDVEDLDENTNLWVWPSDQAWTGQLFWFLTWPISFILFLTTPDCRKCPKLYMITFLMCIFWIGSTSYMVAWLITVVGDTLNIPDSVMGLTFLAAGTSVPEAVSSIIVTNQGHGSMGLSSSIGSNTFDILLCLGLPWLIKTWLYPKVAHDHSIGINSGGLTYSAISLFSTLVLFYLSLLFNRFKLDWKVGLTCLLMYLAFLSFASLVELNVFFPVNLPTCDR